MIDFMDLQIRPIQKNEIMLLTEFIYEAIFQKDPQLPVSRTIIQDPSIWIYIDAFGTKKDDYALVAIQDEKIIGAVWVRCIKAFDQVEDDVPIFSLSVYPEYRKKGVGTQLMKKMLEYLKLNGYSTASLAVQKENYAAQLYLRLGFEISFENAEEYIMIYTFNH